MTQSIAFIAAKGGAGKTTLAWEMAVLLSTKGTRVLLLDIDPQGTLSGLFREREAKENLELIATDVAKLKSRVTQERKAGQWDMILIDTPGKKSEIMPAIEAADLVVFPVQPTSADYLAFDRSFGLLMAQGKKSLVAPNRIKSPRQERDLTTVINGLSQGQAKIAPAVGDRVGFGAYGLEGLALSDIEPDGPGAREIAALLSLAMEMLNGAS